MKASEVHNLKDDELVERIRQTREEQFNLRLQHATGELENTAGVGSAKRNLARALTIARERGLNIHEIR